MTTSCLPIVTPSNTAADALNGTGQLRHQRPGSVQGKCGFGPRLPLLVISPFAKQKLC